MDSEILKNIDQRKLGSSLQEARKARGLTQAAAAENLGIKRTTLVAIEKGERKIAPGELIYLAKLYGRSVSEFVSQRVNAEPFAPQFRLPSGQQTVEETDLRSAVIGFESLARDYVELEEMTQQRRRPSFPAVYTIDVPGVKPEQRGEEVAAEERTRLGLGDGPIADLRVLLEEAVGLRVFYIALPSKMGGIFACNDELGACIAINRLHPVARGNWSLAHEYAHFLSTRYLVDVDFMHNHWGKPASEKFADSFARHFLMPRTGVLRRLTDAVNAHGKGVTVGDVMALSHLYQVSTEAMFRRLEDLRRLSHGTWDRLRADRGFKPEKAKEVLGLTQETWQPALPLRYRLLAMRAYKDERITEAQFAKKLRLDRVSARLELEALESLIDDAGGLEQDVFTPIEVDVSELLSA
ncbi:MAG: XRE family transcriptional regulator [Verrucomicrobiota bacterium]